MQSLRSIPLLRPSRSNSPATRDEPRSATPVPPTTTTTTVNGLSMLNPSYNQDERATRLTERSVSVGGQPRSRSLAKPLAGLAALSLGANNHSNSANVVAPLPISQSSHTLNLPAKTGTSPPGSRPVTPMSGTALPSEGASIDAIGLRLNELVNRTLLGMDLKAMRGVKKGNGWLLGEAVVKELPPPSADAYLLRAVLRTAVRSLTIYISRLEYFLLPGVTHSDFGHPVNLNVVPITSPLLNPIQLYVLSICHAAWETCEVLEVALETTAYPRFVSETLRPIMDKLDSVVARVVMPLMASIKKDLIASLSNVETASPPANTKHLPVGAVTLPAKAITHIPAGLRSFAAKVDPARKAFELICKDCREDGETWIASVVVAVIWKGLCVCTAKYNPDEKVTAHGAGRAPSPEAIGKALASLAKDGLSGGHLKSAPGGVTAVGKMASSILPSRSVSRPPSPPKSRTLDLPSNGSTNGSYARTGSAIIPPSAIALASLEALVTRLVVGLVQKPATIAPAADDPTVGEHLAREALDEALEAIASMRMVIAATEKGAAYISSVNHHLEADIEMSDPQDELVVDAVEDGPAVLLFSIFAKRLNTALASASASVRGRTTDLQLRSPAAVWGISEEDYDRQILSAFSVAEERARRVALAYKSELERISRELSGLKEEEWLEAKRWVKAFALGIQAREGVVVVLNGL